MGWTIVYFLVLRILSVLSMDDQNMPDRINDMTYNLQVISNLLTSGMNNAVHPCNNFYDYVCDKWPENNQIPEGYELWNTHQVTRSNVISTIREILEKQTDNIRNIRLSQEQKLYKICMDNRTSRLRGRNKFIDILRENANEHWPYVVEFYAREIGEVPLFHIKLSDDNLLQILKPYKAETNKKEFDFLNERRLDSNIDKLFELIGEPNDIVSKEELRRFMESVNELVYYEDTVLETITIANFQLLYSDYVVSTRENIYWLRLLNEFAKSSRERISDSEEILVDMEYIMALNEILSNTPSAVIKNYLHYNFIMNPSTYGSINTDINEWSPNKRSIHCVNKMPVHDGLNAELLNHYVPHKNQGMVNETFDMIKNELLREMDNSWFQGHVNGFVMRIIGEIGLKFNTVYNALEWEEQEPISYDFVVVPTGLQNIMNIKQAQMKYLMKNYKRSHSERRNAVRHRRNVEVNLIYGAITNKIYMNPGLMIPPLLHPKAPIAYNYGMLGFLIGHELSHSFDFTRTALHFQNARLSAHLENPIFEKKRQCFKNQFDEKFNIDGEKTLDENVADTEGVKLTFKAMQRYFEARPDDREKKLPGLMNLNAEKLFFISFANQFCTADPNKYQLPRGSSHSPNPYRILGSLMNMNEFAETFNCEPGRYMNPEVKCNMWERELEDI